MYAVLGLEPEASDEAVRRQFKRLAKAFHPDLNPDPAAAARMKSLNEAYRVLGDPIRRATYDSLCGLKRWAEEGADSSAGGGRGLRRYEHELDNEMSIPEMLSRKKAARDLLVRKADYRLYSVSSLDRQSWFRVSVDTGCHCPDALGVAGPFGCKHWYAMEAFRNNGDKPVESRSAASFAGRR
ncbi:MAG TPA: J domain-containing protein [Chloroflexota bacterium]